MARKSRNGRKPIYGKGRKTRVISVPNGLWQAQEWHERGESADTRVVDDWRPLFRPTTKNDALRQIGRVV